jgi:hypothetical protein
MFLKYLAKKDQTSAFFYGHENFALVQCFVSFFDFEFYVLLEGNLKRGQKTCACLTSLTLLA